MKKALLAVAALMLAVGCSHKATTFRVTSVAQTADSELVTGVWDNKEYALVGHPENEDTQVSFHKEPIWTADVGADYPVTLDKSTGDVVIDVPKIGKAHYTIQTVRQK